MIVIYLKGRGEGAREADNEGLRLWELLYGCRGSDDYMGRMHEEQKKEEGERKGLDNANNDRKILRVM